MVLIANRFSTISSRQKDTLFLGLLFFCSGMPALIYQIVWQRVLFAIYGVNSQSVAVVVTAFMLGLGIGSLLGGCISKRFPTHGILIFGVAELGVAVFGLCSLRIFHWVAGFTAGAALGSVVLFTLLLLLVPTVLMGATLPLLVEHLVTRTHRVGTSISTLYFVNTFGSAVACYVCAAFLLRDFGQSGSVTIAACMNATVGVVAYLSARNNKLRTGIPSDVDRDEVGPASATIRLPLGMLLAGVSGFIALGLELAWFRVYSIASADRAPAFALLLSTYLAGIAAGSLLSEKLTNRMRSEGMLHVVGAALLLAGAISILLPPLVAMLVYRGIPFLYSAPGFFVTAALVGSILPLVCQLSVNADRSAGQGVSLIYVSNIVGSAAGSLGIGFVVMNHFTLRQVTLLLSLAAICLGFSLFVFAKLRPSIPPAWALLLAAACFITTLVSGPQYSLLFERLTFGKRAEASIPFARTVENRNGVIGVTWDGAVFGEGVYDGYFNVEPTNDVNLVARAYALSAFCPTPSASW
jgi:predicted membrane-bound spermidine synthase